MNDTHTHADPLLAGLASLAAPAPDRLLDRIAARWTLVPAAPGDAFIAFTERGVAFLRTVESVGSAEEFGRSFAQRFAMPLLPAERPPAGLRTALRTGRGIGLDLRGLTAFQESVLRAAMTIPRGEVRPYGWIARRIGKPRAVRAVGTALGNNPVPLLIPCHRVVPAGSGTGGGYIFGPAVKEALLRAEGTNMDEMAALARSGVHYLASDSTGIVCYPTCRNARRITRPHRREFATITAARDAGFRPCRHCQPAA